MLAPLTFLLVLGPVFAAPEPWPFYLFIASLEQNNQHFCSGVFVKNTRLVLTPASCLEQLPNLRNIQARPDAPPWETYYVRDILIYPSWDKLVLFDNDIALLYLHKTPQRAKPLKMGSAGSVSRLRAYALEPKTRRVNVTFLEPVSTDKYCKSTEAVICAKKYRPDCNSDSGGPVINERYNEVVGLLPVVPWYTCNKDDTQAFVRLDNYKDWIEDEYQKLSKKKINKKNKNLNRHG
ncbi:mite allergen Der p 3-like [Tribolium madens]|uniref:mite allergen Der p 3-like n=1 Tax=Tribolium madens TaxID=41895 RepID=UPI001CF73786|nr:mite allergen Der p 3-like [Tribolium madens]